VRLKAVFRLFAQAIVAGGGAPLGGSVEPLAKRRSRARSEICALRGYEINGDLRRSCAKRRDHKDAIPTHFRLIVD